MWYLREVRKVNRCPQPWHLKAGGLWTKWCWFSRFLDLNALPQDSHLNANPSLAFCLFAHTFRSWDWRLFLNLNLAPHLAHIKTFTQWFDSWIHSPPRSAKLTLQWRQQKSVWITCDCLKCLFKDLAQLKLLPHLLQRKQSVCDSTCCWSSQWAKNFLQHTWHSNLAPLW